MQRRLKVCIIDSSYTLLGHEFHLGANAQIQLPQVGEGGGKTVECAYSCTVQNAKLSFGSKLVRLSRLQLTQTSPPPSRDGRRSLRSRRHRFPRFHPR